MMNDSQAITMHNQAMSPLTQLQETIQLQAKLQEQESVIERSREKFVEIGRALRTIRDEGLYKARWNTFEAYCTSMWDWSRANAYQYIYAAEVVEDLTTELTMYSRLYIPKAKSHAVKLHPLTNDERVEAAKGLYERDLRGEHITNIVVDEVIRAITGKQPPSIPDGATYEVDVDPCSSTIESEERPLTVASIIEVAQETVGLDESVSHEASVQPSTLVMPPGFHVILPEQHIPEELKAYAKPCHGGWLVPFTDAGLRTYRQSVAAAATSGDGSGMTRRSTTSDLAARAWTPIVRSVYRDFDGLQTGEQLEHAAFYPSRLLQVEQTTLQNGMRTSDAPANERFVVVCPGVDLCDPIIPNTAISMVLQAIEHAPDWTFLIVTSFPDRLSQFAIPRNVLAGVVAETAAHVPQAEAALSKVQTVVPWIYVRHVDEPIALSSPTNVRWIVLDSDGPISLGFVEDLLGRRKADGFRVVARKSISASQEWPDLPAVDSMEPPKTMGPDRSAIEHATQKMPSDVTALLVSPKHTTT